MLLLGPRQCGKTTLAKTSVKARYFDFERPSDLQLFANDIEFALQSFSSAPLILDEAQSLPTLFPALRAAIDGYRRRHGRYLLLGSVSPDLLKHIAESLAGRIGILELTPFLYSEVARRKGMRLEALWLRGGFPDALLARSVRHWQAWQENYVRTFIERDIARHRLTFSAIEMRRLMTMVAHVHGGVLNASELGRSLGYSYHTIQHVLDLLEGYFLARRLLPYHANLGKRLTKSPKLYVRDSGILHHLLGIASPEQLLTSPARGSSFEGFMIEQLIAREKLRHPGSAFYYFRTQTGAEIDLIIDRGQERVGIEFKSGVAVEHADWRHLKMGLTDGIIHRGLVIYNGTRAFQASDKVSVMSAAQALAADREM
ncbi:MAG: ATP-binding protein [Steroidobacteraceae bacterium]